MDSLNQVFPRTFRCGECQFIGSMRSHLPFPQLKERLETASTPDFTHLSCGTPRANVG
ncbi:hypothetical protein [Nostoc sp.]|uniref:hypothetical protein n=1 Tax=Nostoc sp. TaxID=1180 RepID=UPI002FF8EA56